MFIILMWYNFLYKSGGPAPALGHFLICLINIASAIRFTMMVVTVSIICKVSTFFPPFSLHLYNSTFLNICQYFISKILINFNVFSKKLASRIISGRLFCCAGTDVLQSSFPKFLTISHSRSESCQRSAAARSAAARSESRKPLPNICFPFAFWASSFSICTQSFASSL